MTLRAIPFDLYDFSMSKHGMPPQASLSPNHRARKTYARRNELGIHGDELGMACIALSAIVDQSHREKEYERYMQLSSLYKERH